MYFLRIPSIWVKTNVQKCVKRNFCSLMFSLSARGFLRAERIAVGYTSTLFINLTQMYLSKLNNVFVCNSTLFISRTKMYFSKLANVFICTSTLSHFHQLDSSVFLQIDKSIYLHQHPVAFSMKIFHQLETGSIQHCLPNTFVQIEFVSTFFINLRVALSLLGGILFLTYIIQICDLSVLFLSLIGDFYQNCVMLNKSLFPSAKTKPKPCKYPIN